VRALAAGMTWDFWTEADDGRWEPETHAIILEHVRPGSTFVDIGAWIGPTALWAAPVAGRVVAIEPDPVALDALIPNVAPYPNVEVIRGAISMHTGVTELCPRGAFGDSMSRVIDGATAEWDHTAAVCVSCWTLPDLFRTFAVKDVSLVKMDIEGGEADLLPTVAPFLRASKIPLLVSLHEPWCSRPLEKHWFNGFHSVTGEVSGFNTVLAIP